MHAILHLKSNWPITKNNEAFEEGLGEASAGGFLVHDNRSQLLRNGKVSEGERDPRGTIYLVISDKNNLLATKDKGDHTLW